MPTDCQICHPLLAVLQHDAASTASGPVSWGHGCEGTRRAHFVSKVDSALSKKQWVGPGSSALDKTKSTNEMRVDEL
jgi:hypothetical protein